MEVFAEIADGARGRERASGRRRCSPATSASSWPCSRRSPRSTWPLGLETVYEAYLVHYGRPRLFAAPDADEAILLGDYLYAHGLVRVADAGGVPAVSVLADLIARCAALRADGAEGDGEAWVDAARALGGSPSEDEVASALALHFARVAA